MVFDKQEYVYSAFVAEKGEYVISKEFALNEQQDAHEFLRLLLQRMREAYEDRNARGKPMTEMFRGRLRTAMKCLECNNVSILESNFEEIQLNASIGSSQIALQRHHETEILTNIGYNCDACEKKNVPMEKVFSVQKWPKVLFLMFKMF